VFSILIIQALTMATAGAVLGLGCVAGIQNTFSEPRAPIVIPWWLSLGSCVLVSVICLISALLPYLRIRKIDPMMVLQS
jgi:ABC-type antimicrobial peptide transport system permease subunit